MIKVLYDTGLLNSKIEYYLHSEINISNNKTKIS